MDEDPDYSKWQRQSLTTKGLGYVVDENRRESSRTARPVLPSRKTTTRETIGTKTTSIGTRTNMQRESACSSLCRHWPNTRKADVKKVDKDYVSPDVIQILRFQIKAKRNCILECRKQIMNLIEENFKLKQEIEGSNKGAHIDVNEQLRKYHKYRNAMQTINFEHGKQKNKVKDEYDKVKKSTEKMTVNLEKKLKDVENMLERKQKELKTLNNYKDKEYPEKVLKIGKLRNALEYLREEQGIDVSEIKKIIEIEEGKYKDIAVHRESELLEGIRSDVFNSLDRTVKEKAIQNLRFKKEIEIHKKEKAKLEEETKILEDKISKLINKDRPAMKRDLYPGVFRVNDICTPDMDIVLRIPKKEFIPL